jgi:hypothetical protein
VAARKTFVRLCLTSILIAGCATKRVGQEEYATSGTHDIVVRAISYDDNGLPISGTPLADRPSKLGDHFTVVRLLRDQPVISYDIAVVRQRPDFARPLQVVYEWTGKGFTLGANVTRAMVNSAIPVQVQTQNSDAAFFVLAIMVTPTAAGAVGGFIVGIADGARQTALELSKMIVPGEELLTWTTFEYDGLNRLVLMRMFSPDRMQELVRTRFAYEGAGTVPSRTTVKTLAEGKERDID